MITSGGDGKGVGPLGHYTAHFTYNARISVGFALEVTFIITTTTPHYHHPHHFAHCDSISI